MELSQLQSDPTCQTYTEEEEEREDEHEQGAVALFNYCRGSARYVAQSQVKSSVKESCGAHWRGSLSDKRWHMG